MDFNDDNEHTFVAEDYTSKFGSYWLDADDIMSESGSDTEYGESDVESDSSDWEDSESCASEDENSAN